MIFFALVIVKYMKKNRDKTKPCYGEQILTFPLPFITTRFCCKNI